MRRNIQFCNHLWVVMSRPSTVGMLDRKKGVRVTHDNIVTCRTYKLPGGRKKAGICALRFSQIRLAGCRCNQNIVLGQLRSSRTRTDTWFAEEFVCTFNYADISIIHARITSSALLFLLQKICEPKNQLRISFFLPVEWSFQNAYM